MFFALLSTRSLIFQGQELDISVQGAICSRFTVKPYEKQAQRGIESVVEHAILKNTRDRTVLGDKLESWAENWLSRVAKDADNSPIEYIPIGGKADGMATVHERIAEFTRRKQEQIDEEKGEL